MSKGTIVSIEQKQGAIAAVKGGADPAAVAKGLRVTANTVRKWVVGKDIGKRGAPKAPAAPTANGSQHDAIIYLRHARDSINEDLRAGRIKRLSRAHLLTMLALETLGGGP